jgi:hypothetical protein
MGEVVSFRRSQTKVGRRKYFSPSRPLIVPALFGVAIAGFAFLEFGFPLIGCDVKANISSNTGERIYHVPGQKYYSQTKISWLAGERWFCSEAAARAAGWRKALR